MIRERGPGIYTIMLIRETPPVWLPRVTLKHLAWSERCRHMLRVSGALMCDEQERGGKSDMLALEVHK